MPEGPWARPVLAAVLVCGALAGAAEGGWRAAGHRPSADAEDLDLWAIARARASNHDVNTIVIIGKSRAQLDVHGPTLRRRYPQSTVVQLALRGRGAWAAFVDLAADEAFAGRVLWFLTEPDLTPQAHREQQPAVDRAHHLGPDGRTNAWLRAQVASTVTFRHADLRPRRVLENLARGRAVPPHFVVMGPDRFAAADFDRVDVERLRGQIAAVHAEMRARMAGRSVDPARWRADVAQVRPHVARLRARGGDVVFVAPPVSGASAAFSEAFYPRAAFWDTLTGATGVLTVHHQDLGGPPFVCPDTSHLDAEDAPRFTATLLDRLVAMGFLAAR